jgi:hypothetical protein
VVRRTIAEAAVWSAAHAFDRGETVVADAFLGFALATSPGIEAWPACRRLQWKRRVGPTAWRLISPIAERARRLAQPPGERSSA